jgi:hypothetical protein
MFLARQSITKPPGAQRVDWTHPLSRGLRNAWLMGEGAGERAADAAGNWPLTNALTTGTIKWGGSQYGHALRCPGGTGQRWKAAGSQEAGRWLWEQGVGTVAVLTRPAAAATSVWFDNCDGSSSVRGFHFRMSSDRTILWTCFRAGFGTIWNLSTTGTLTLDRWALVTATADGATARVYVNGVVDATTAVLSTLGSGTAGNELSLGNYAVATSGGFQGMLAGAWIWDRALSAAEIKQHAAAPFAMCAAPASWRRWVSAARFPFLRGLEPMGGMAAYQ